MVLYVGKKKPTNKTNAHCSRIKTMKRLRNLNKQLMSLPHTNIYWIKSRSSRVKAEDQWWYSYITNKSMVNKKYWVFQQHNWKVPLETCKRTEVKKKKGRVRELSAGVWTEHSLKLLNCPHYSSYLPQVNTCFGTLGQRQKKKKTNRKIQHSTTIVNRALCRTLFI